MATIELEVKKIYPDISKSEQRAADFFLNNKEAIFHYPLATLAKLSKTSQGAWVRFCKSLGYDGMKSLKNTLFNEINNAKEEADENAIEFSDIHECSSISAIAKNVCNSSASAIHMTYQLLDESLLEKVAELVIHARSIRLFGLGASGLVAMDLYYKFLRIGFNVTYTSDFHISMTYASTSTADDIALVFSNSGETSEIIKTVHVLKENHTSTVAITKYTNNTLSKAADYTLYMNSPEIFKRSGAMSSRIAQLCLADVLFTVIANRDYQKIEGNLEKSYNVVKSLSIKDHF